MPAKPPTLDDYRNEIHRLSCQNEILIATVGYLTGELQRIKNTAREVRIERDRTKADHAETD